MLGRNAEREPLTDIESEVFYRVLLEHVEAEFNPRAERMVFTGHPGNE